EPGQSLIPPYGKVNADDTTDKSLSKASVQPVTQSKSKINLKTKKKKIPPSSKPKSPYKVRVILPKKQIAETQHAEVTVATTDATKSLVASELAKEQVNQPSATKAEKVPEKIVKIKKVAEEQSLEIPTVEQLLDKVDKHTKVVQETPKSPYDTESEIKDQIMHNSEETYGIQEDSDSDLKSMPDDDLRYVSEFEADNFDDTNGHEASQSDYISQYENASAERISLPDHMDHICEEVSSFHSKLRDMESS
ncbi:hypothetical protein Tco_1558684, partial [Tanacetum coccineum]